MYIVIAGGGIVGRNLIKKLSNEHDLVVIDIDRQVCEQIYSQFGAVSVHGSATKVGVLKDAGIEKADAAVAVMRNDADNLAFTVLANNFDVDKIMVRMRDPEYESAYRSAGASTIGSVMDMMVGKFANDIEEPKVRRLASLGDGKAEISIITIPEESHICGMTVSEITSQDEFPDEVVIAGIYNKEEDELIIPRGHRRIHSGNQVFLVANEEEMHRAAEFMVPS
ncbi:potassium channel family protein [Halarsenatibacter silvermanii]|uniref:Trk system potassium uptake protein TrkA n=1 Tax=Halarsenatibacter silvermanii TaxID=321763 RepID=A0A1G9KWH6_9FIRM|nr:TrkA family potassium uptake protein [Halarsenatibacter silvermanii]SDL53807.1 trk system potassium uptake protein TrkA [Halarsenatibacter silvermanii]